MITSQSLHLVQISPWPWTSSLRVGGVLISTAYIFNYEFSIVLPLSTFFLLLSLLVWWRDVVREASFMGSHTLHVRRGLEWGIILFISSEVIFFFAFFWAFFHRRLSPTGELGSIWPPVGIEVLNPFSIPLLNTVVLLTSGVSATYGHHRIINNRIATIKSILIITIILGIYFTILQAREYKDAAYCIRDRVYGATFFVATGFHGCHVIIGSLFLLVIAGRCFLFHFSKEHHFGFEAAAWYWHFVDVVWIFLFLTIYWWGGK